MPNRLVHETSPYLQQHAGNPVDWHTWDEEALKLARDQDKPILLSVGYSACHWCHVMARESFEDLQTAAIMNALFVNIKVDREERPDLDRIYQTAHHLLTQRSGGWPLTMFLTPEQKPFFGGTYFPKNSRYGLPGFVDLLQRISMAYREKRGEIDRQNESLLELLSTILPASTDAVELTRDPITAAAAEMRSGFDEIHGGIGAAPKFPHPFELAFCLRASKLPGQMDLRDLVILTLKKMAQGGIYDQLGGGFCRYSTDARWLIPHFEKMLYDNGPLLHLYADAWASTGDPLFRRVCEEVAGWAIREMQSADGGYYSSLDADSEHEEGRYYVWTREEFAAALSKDEYEIAGAYFGLDRAPNFDGRAWNLHVAESIESIAAKSGRDLPACMTLLQTARDKLLAARNTRVRPGRDEKILTSWNALMIEGLVHAARVFSRGDWHESARRAMDFLTATMWQQGRLLATCKDGRAHLNAYLDDYAFLLTACLEMLQAEFVAADLQLAIALADTLLTRFEDRSAGGFFFTSDDHEALILRPKPGADNATPSGNGLAALALTRLGYLLGQSRYLQAADDAVRLFFPTMLKQPGAYSTLCAALWEGLEPTSVVVLRGPLEELHGWQRAVSGKYLPDAMTLAIDSAASGLPGVLNKPAGDTVNAYLCRGVTCLEPLDSVGDLLANLESR